MIWRRLAWREIINTPKFSLFFVLNIALGLTGFITVSALKSSVDQSLSGKSREILGADIAVSAFRTLTQEEIAGFDALVPRGTQTAEESGWVSMVAAVTDGSDLPPPARLMEIRAVDPTFPFYGEITFTGEDGKSSNDAIFRRMEYESIALAAPELYFQLDLKPGQVVKIGDQVFRLAGTIVSDPSTSSASFSIAPRIYIGRNWAKQTGLIQMGSRITHARQYALPNQTTESAQGSSQRDLEIKFKDFAKTRSDLRVRSHTSATDELGRILKFLGDYLGIIALVAIILSGIGGNFLILAHVRTKIRDLAILQSIGARPSSARWIIGWQLIILGFGGAVCAVVIAAILLPSIREILAPFLGTAIKVTIQNDSVITALIMGTLGTPIAALPVFVHLEGMSAATLFREHQDPSRIKPLGWLMAALPSTAIIFGLASWQARSPKAGILFLIITGIAILILAGSGILLLRSLEPISNLIKQKTGRKSWPILMALRHTRRSGQTLMVSFVTLGLCAALISAVPQVQAILTSELTSSDKTLLPGLFLFDIQPEQELPLQQFLESRNLSPGSFAPLIRARLDRINDKITGETFDNIPGTRERQTEEQFKNRTYNLSVRGRLTASEALAAGREFETVRYDPKKQDIPEISLEKRFAERTRINLGDTLEFNVQGVTVKGKVVNFRRVRWASFQPNFFVQFQEGVIDDAPRTYLGTVGQTDFDTTQKLQRELAQSFSNVSIVDVKSSVTRILAISQQVALAITAMALLCLLAGMGVLTAITLQQSRARSYETAILKVLGATFREVYTRVLGEAAIVAFFAASTGLVISFGIAWVLSVFIFDGVWVFAATAAVIPALLIFALTLFITMATSRIALGTNARELLQSDP